MWLTPGKSGGRTAVFEQVVFDDSEGMGSRQFGRRGIAISEQIFRPVQGGVKWGDIANDVTAAKVGGL